MKNVIKIFLLLISSLMLIACSDESSSDSTETKKDHVWKEQTDTINKAKEVEGMIMGAAEETRKAIEQQGE
jgi:outer membrane biogenesis lipoprotein LolB